MRSRPAVPAVATVVVVLASSCVDARAPTGPGAMATAALDLVPRYVAGPAEGTAAEVNHIRVVANLVPEDTVLATFDEDVDPSQSQWSLQLDVPVPANGGTVVLTIELIHVEAATGAETVEWSGRTQPIPLTPGVSSEIRTVNVVRGPPQNLGVSAIAVSPDSSRIAEGDSIRLAAAVTAAASSSPPQVYWTSLDTAIASVSATGLVRGLAPGVARVAAQAGAPADTVVVVVVPEVDLSLTKTVSRDTVSPGDTLSFTLKVVSRGPAAARAIRILDTPDAGVVDTSSLALLELRGAWQLHADTAVVDSLAPGDSALAVLRARIADAPAPAPGVHANRAVILGVAPPTLLEPTTKDTAVASFHVRASGADIQVTKSADRKTAVYGDTLAYTVTVTNHGPAQATRVALTDTLSAGLQFLGDTTAQGSYDSQTGVWSVGTLASGASATLRLRAVAAKITAVRNHAFVSAVDQADPAPGNEGDSADVVVFPDTVGVRVTLAASMDTAQVGDTILYKVGVGNSGPATAELVEVADSLPPNVTLVRDSASLGTYAGGVWSIPSLGLVAASDNELYLWVRVDTAAAGTTLLDRARLTGLSASSVDRSTTDDTASASTIVPAAAYRVTKSVNKSAPTEGDSVVFTVVSRALDPVPADTLVLADRLPAGLTFVDYQASRGAYDHATGQWRLPAGYGAADTLLVRALVSNATAGHTLWNRARVVLSVPYDTSSADRDSVAVSPRGTDAALSMSELYDRTSVSYSSAGQDSLIYRLYLRNNGPAPITGVVVHDTVPAGIDVFANAQSYGSGTSWSVAGGVGVWTVDTLQPGATDSLRIQANYTRSDQLHIVNRARIVSMDQTDTLAADDTASWSTTIRAALAIVSDSVRSGAVALPYADTLRASGGYPPYAWSIIGTLPAGLSLDSVSGEISGTPTEGTCCASFSVQVLDAQSQAAVNAYDMAVAYLDQENVPVGAPPSPGIGRFDDADNSPDPAGTSFDWQDAQSFVLVTSYGTLADIALPIVNDKNATDSVTLTFWQGYPEESTPAKLGSINLPASAFVGVVATDPATWPVFDLSGLGINLQADRTYFFTVQTVSPVPFAYNPDSNAGYPSGQAYRRNYAVLPSTWSAQPTDYGFRIWIREIPSSPGMGGGTATAGVERHQKRHP